MIDETMGSIGSTQGEKLSSTPSTKKTGTRVVSDPECNAAEIVPSPLAAGDWDKVEFAPDAAFFVADATLPLNCTVRVSGG